MSPTGMNTSVVTFNVAMIERYSSCSARDSFCLIGEREEVCPSR
jgi:hypothetical protein